MRRAIEFDQVTRDKQTSMGTFIITQNSDTFLLLCEETKKSIDLVHHFIHNDGARLYNDRDLILHNTITDVLTRKWVHRRKRSNAEITFPYPPLRKAPIAPQVFLNTVVYVNRLLMVISSMMNYSTDIVTILCGWRHG